MCFIITSERKNIEKENLTIMQRIDGKEERVIT